jgi:hypothetical protein
MKNKILSAVIVTIAGFIMLNLAFLFVSTIPNGLLLLYVRVISNNYPDINTTIMLGYIFLIFSILLLSFISFFILKSKKFKLIYKASYSIIPLATVYAVIGRTLFQLPIIVYLISALFFIGVFYYLYKTKKPWLYYYSLILISVIMLIGSLLHVDI